MKRIIIILFVILITLLSYSQNEKTGGSDDPRIVGLESYTGVQKTVSIRVEVTDPENVDKLELFASKNASDTEAKALPVASTSTEPFTLNWDTIKGPDGLFSIYVKATKSSGESKSSAPIFVIVYNKGQEIVFQDGSFGEIEIPQSGGNAKAAKHYWDNPKDIHTIMIVTKWIIPQGKTSVPLELTTGFGGCPMEGQMVGDPIASDNGVLFLNVTAEGQFIQTGKHFIHIEAKDQFSFKGNKYSYSVKGYIFKETFSEPAQPVISNLKNLDEISGNSKVEVKFTSPVGIEKIELYSTQSLKPLAITSTPPYTLNFDSLKIPDGLLSVFVRTREKSGRTSDSDPINIIVANHDQKVSLTEDSSGILSIPTAGECEGIKIHWDNSDNIRSFMAVIEYDIPQGQPNIKFESSIGIGDCIKRGEVIGKPVVTSQNPILISAIADNSKVQTGQHFLVLKPTNLESIRGKSYSYKIRVYAFKLEPEFVKTIPYTVLKGSVNLEVDAYDESGVTKVELFVGNQTKSVVTSKTSPFTLKWDTSKIPDGLVSIFLRETNSKKKTIDSKPIPVIILNTGKEVQFTNGNTGNLEVPLSGEFSSAKHYWENSAGFKRIITVVEWQYQANQQTLPFELTIGNGRCPMLGNLYGDPAKGLISPLNLDISAPNYTFQTGKHFVKLKVEDFFRRKGEKFPYTIKAYLLK